MSPEIVVLFLHRMMKRATDIKCAVTGIFGLLMMASCEHEPLLQPTGSEGKAVVNDNGSNSNNGNVNGGNNGTPCDPNTVYFSTQVLPLLVSNCAKSGCHDAASHEDGIILDSYVNVMNTADIDPGNPRGGHLMEAITESDPDDRMPPPPALTLTAQQIDLINTWIVQGAQNLTCTITTCDSTAVSFANDVLPVINNKCKGCHSGIAPGGGISFTDYTGTATQAGNGKLLGSITHAAGFQPMPKNSAMLSACEIGVIRNWIGEGIQNN
jgi:hypothetical protein